MLETSHRKQPKSTFFFSKKNQQLKTCSVWILRYYTLKKVTCPLKRGQFPPGKDRTPTTIFSVTSLEESHLELRISIFQVGGRYRKMSSFVLCSSREVDPRWHTRSEASPGGTLHWSRFLATLKNHLCNQQQQKRNSNSNFFEGECLDGNKSNGKSRGH